MPSNIGKEHFRIHWLTMSYWIAHCINAFKLGGQPLGDTFAHGKGTPKMDNICHSSSIDRSLHFSETENHYLEDPCPMLLAFLLFN